MLDVLNFEYLEANFYSYITTGAPISSSLMGSDPGPITGGGSAVSFSDPNVAALAMQLAADEVAHVTAIRATLAEFGYTPVSQPALDVSALGAVTSDASFLAIARALETVGTSAYEGGIQYLTSSVIAVTLCRARARYRGAARGHPAAVLHCQGNQLAGGGLL